MEINTYSFLSWLISLVLIPWVFPLVLINSLLGNNKRKPVMLTDTTGDSIDDTSNDTSQEETSNRVFTVRAVLISKVLLNTAGLESNAPSFRGLPYPETLTNDLLDAQLDTKQANHLYDKANAADFEFVRCALCNTQRLASFNDSHNINEIAQRPLGTRCCRGVICKGCYLDAVIESLYKPKNWLTENFTRHEWIVCPAPYCDQPLPIRSCDTLEHLLLQLGDRDITTHLAEYDRLDSLRHAVEQKWHVPRWELEPRRLAGLLHDQCIQRGFMSPVFRATDVEMIEIENNRGVTYQIPLLVQDLIRYEAPKECVICAEEFTDIDIGSIGQWLNSFREFKGDWKWKILDFPIKLMLRCEHTIDFCKGCLDRHIQSHLEQFGTPKCNQIACPSEGCDRVLRYNEIRVYASKETFTTYDRYLNLQNLANSPSFRWCLRPGCGNGQVYRLARGGQVPVAGPMVKCRECGFQMCYRHSVPWHRGETCEQYVIRRGDPDGRLSLEWISSNTKNCPRCNVSIQKGESCYHMTCTCGHEFCWDCLVDWRLIMPTWEVYRRDQHGVGCFFRTSNLTPFELAGNHEALRRRRRALR